MTSAYVTVSPVLSATTPAVTVSLWSTLTFRGRPRVPSACTLQGQTYSQDGAHSLTPHSLNEDFGVQGNPPASSPLLPGLLGQEQAVC